MPRQPAANAVIDAAEIDSGTAQVHRPIKPLNALEVIQGHPHHIVLQLHRDAMRLSVVNAARPRIQHVLPESAPTSVVHIDVQSPVEEFHANAAAVSPRTAVQYQAGRLYRPEIEFQLAAVAGLPRRSDVDVRTTGSERDLWFWWVDNMDIAADADVVRARGNVVQSY